MDQGEVLDVNTVLKGLLRDDDEELDNTLGSILPMWRHSIEQVRDSSCWPEVDTINHYAMLMGHLSMAVKGLGFLVFTWTTVVLLGGYVSLLDKKDFWCLAVITVAGTAGAFDIFLNEKLRNIDESILLAIFHLLPYTDIVDEVILAVQTVMYAIVSCLLCLVYMFGLYISAGLSLWRLIQHDYGNTNGDATKANLKPALDLLYSMALAQGVLFGYRTIYYSSKHKVAKEVASKYMFDQLAGTSVYRYLRDTRIGCEKNPSFAKGRNLITYAVDLLKSEGSLDRYLDGIRILDTLIAPKCLRWDLFWTDVQRFIGQNMLIRELLIHSSSSSHILHKLLLSLDTRSPYGREIRVRAARIVTQLADGIHLEQFPRGIHCISSLLNMFEEQPLLEPFERDWLLRTFGQSKMHEGAHLLILPQPQAEDDKKMKRKKEKKKKKKEKEDGDSELLKDYKNPVIQGLRILKKLAADEENCRIISNTQGLLSKIMAPVTSDLLHQFDHSEWSDITEESLKVMCQLVTAPGEIGTELRGEISGHREAMASIERILRCDICKDSYPRLHKQAIKNLLGLMDACSSMSTGCRESIVNTLVGIFIDEGNVNDLRQFAGEKLVTLCLQSRSSANIVLQANDDVVGNLTNILRQVKSKRNIRADQYTDDCEYKSLRESADRANKYRIFAANRIHNNHRIIAARVLEGICIHHSNDDDECLKKVLIDVMQKILGEILHYGEEKASLFSSADKDIERQDVDVSEVNGKKYVSSSQQQYDGKLQATLLSLCVMICDTMISADIDLALLFNEIGTGDHTFSFVRKLKEMVERNSSHPTAECLTILELTTNMVISMMKHRGSYANDELDSLMVALSNASKALSVIEGSMVFASQQDDGTMTRNIAKTLTFLVKEAQELVNEKKKNHELEIVPT